MVGIGGPEEREAELERRAAYDDIVASGPATRAERDALRAELFKGWERRRRAISAALEAVHELSDETRADLRLQLLKRLSLDDREMWASVLAMRSSERQTSRLVGATWGLVTATVGLVIATVVLVIVTVVHH